MRVCLVTGYFCDTLIVLVRVVFMVWFCFICDFVLLNLVCCLLVVCFRLTYFGLVFACECC